MTKQLNVLPPPMSTNFPKLYHYFLLAIVVQKFTVHWKYILFSNVVPTWVICHTVMNMGVSLLANYFYISCLTIIKKEIPSFITILCNLKGTLWVISYMFEIYKLLLLMHIVYIILENCVKFSLWNIDMILQFRLNHDIKLG